MEFARGRISSRIWSLLSRVTTNTWQSGLDLRDSTRGILATGTVATRVMPSVPSSMKRDLTFLSKRLLKSSIFPEEKHTPTFTFGEKQRAAFTTLVCLKGSDFHFSPISSISMTSQLPSSEDMATASKSETRTVYFPTLGPLMGVFCLARGRVSPPENEVISKPRRDPSSPLTSLVKNPDTTQEEFCWRSCSARRLTSVVLPTPGGPVMRIFVIVSAATNWTQTFKGKRK